MTFLQRFLEGENWEACGRHTLQLSASNQHLLPHLMTPQARSSSQVGDMPYLSLSSFSQTKGVTVCHTVGVRLHEATKLERSICALFCIFQCNQVLLQVQTTAFSQPPHENAHLGRETHSTPRPPDVLCLGHQAALCLCATCRLPPRSVPFLPSGPSFRSWLSCAGPLGTAGQPRVSPWLLDICVEIYCERSVS